ncbi:hypothetical protein, conserved [Trypanosoma brucei brucei TREU927]|uniref:Uncharacterized protein n=1 Tax=Trypanosoma brucei brucei (strain 927/4 GUTat10.1) TaxID=185431 RepID=Q583W5_TRYB2|nr:hypothetical protein, conserved [Trypanosoma brucei brucei TREU927]AAX79842.1 hypothetical protein, conserved [Trypanosoma brucei]AAZ10879.1 hypothetical protein, conserved [Trypanosoma brucei brucei TREU927]
MMNPEDVLQSIANVCRTGHLGDAAAAGIKAYIAAPFKHSNTSHSSTTVTNSSTMANIPPANVTAAPPTGLGGVGGGFTTSIQQQPFALLNTVKDTQASHVTATDELDEQVSKIKSLMNLLLLCGDPERFGSVTCVIASIAPTVSSNVVNFIKTEISPTSLSLIDHGPVASSLASNGKSNPVLLAAQCLFLLTRHFQMNPDVVRGICELLEILLQEMSCHTNSSTTSAASFRQHPSTRGLCALTWFVTMSLVNTLAVWQKLRGATGVAQENALLGSNIVADIEKWATNLHARLERTQDTGFLSSSLQMRRGISQQYQHDEAAWRGGNGKRPRWLVIVDGYMSIVLLALGMFLCGKGDERGLDKAVEAFVGDCAHSTGAGRRGKVMKYIVDLAPLQAMLAIPLECIYIIPYEMAAYMFDEMLVAVKHVADIDVSSCVRYLEALQSKSDASYAIKGDVAAADGGLQRPEANKAQAGEEPFISETAHILRALTICLENLPSTVLNPDIDVDCAVTFFIFKNCVTHMRAIFETQRSSGAWEAYTLKVVTRFLDVLAMIGRNPQYTQRVVALFSEMQVNCAELQWSSLIAKAQACAGASGDAVPLTLCDNGGSMAALRKPSVSGAAAPGRHRQFTPEYLQEKQQEFASSVFVLLRQMATHPLLSEQVRQHTTLNVVLGFLHATKLSQLVLGRVLSLIGSLITNHEEAACVWTYLEESHLICSTENAAAQTKGGQGSSTVMGNKQRQGDNVAVTVEARSLLGHCQYECHHATYSITIGFLDLMLAMFKYHRPDVTCLPTYATIIRFISEEIFRGVSRRSFSCEKERYIVTALAAVVLNRALSLHLPLHGKNNVPSFQLVMACSKAPADVLGELLHIIGEAAGALHEMDNYQRAAVRQCLALLRTAITVKEEQRLDNIFTFDARTHSSKEFAAQLLPLCVSFDSLLANKALQVLLLLPHSTLSEAARYWDGRPDALETVITPYVSTLREEAVSNPVIHAPPALAVLDSDEVQLLMPYVETETKSLMLDLLIQHAAAPQPSITSWLCGYQMYGSTEELLPGYCLEPIIDGARSRVLEEKSPHIAVKYVKLLYQLRANPSLCTPSLKRLMRERGTDEMFHVLKTLRPDQCPPLVMSKYAFVMKLLGLELFSVGTEFLEELNALSPLTPHASVVELLFQLLQAAPPHELYRQTSESGAQLVLEDHNNGVALDFAQWPSSCLMSLPPFPANCVAPGGAESYVFRASDDVPQYSIPRLYEALRRENIANKGEAPSGAELREQLGVFARANECLLAYASAVQFLDGWCTLTNITVVVLDRISHERVVYLARSMLGSVQLISNLTVAAQEQIVHRVSRTMSTLAAQLRRKLGRNTNGEGLSGATATCAGDEGPVEADVSVPQTAQQDVTSFLQVTGTKISAFGTNASLTRGRLTGGSKRDPRGAVVSRMDATGVISTLVEAPSRAAIHSENLQLLRTLLIVTVQWGSRVPQARQHLYDAISAFLSISGTNVDDITLQQYHNALFDILVQDTSATATNGNKFAALPLLSQLMYISPQLCELLCVSLTNDGVSPRLMSCVAQCFQAIDESICAFFSHGGASVSSILWFVRVVFDMLMVISQRHSLQLFHANALTHCMGMKLWSTCARIMLGHVKYAAGTSLSNTENIEVFKEVIHNVLLSTIRWFNAVLSALDNSESALGAVADFVFSQQLLFQSVLVSPTTSEHRRFIDTPTLEMYGEIGGLLLRLASSPLVDECRPFVQLFALTELLDVLTRSEFINTPIFLEDRMPNSVAAVPLSSSQSGSLPSIYQRQLIAVATQNIVLFIFFVERLVQHFNGYEGNVPSAQQQPELQKKSYLRDDPRSRFLITTITENVVAIMEKFCDGQVLHVATVVPYFVATHSLVLLLHAFLLVDRAFSLNNVNSNNQWGGIVHALEEARRVVGLWRALHSDYHKGVKVSRTGGRWSVAAPSLSNQTLHHAAVMPVPPAEVESPSAAGSRAAAGEMIHADNAAPAPAENGTNMASITSGTVCDRTTIGALVELSRIGCMDTVSDEPPVYKAVDQVVLMESFLRRVKVAISNALREASRM